jgi:hypothetical protein
MSRAYFATVVAIFVTTSIATNLLVVGTRGPVAPGLPAWLRARSRRLGRNVKRLADIWVAAMIARRERRATTLALHRTSDRHRTDMGVYRGLPSQRRTRRHDRH